MISPDPNTPVLIAGGGIAGLAMALTLHEIGVPCRVFEAAREMRPLGVGINIQPNAVRELMAMGIGPDKLDEVGLPVKEWALLGLNGKEVYAEPRGEDAGYRWPQYAAHRGQLHMLLYAEVRARLGDGAVVLGARVQSYTIDGAGGVSVQIAREGRIETATGALLIAADGLHSNIRAQMHPAQPPIQWGGAMLWRGTSRAKPLRTGSSFIGLGTHRRRMVIYPISQVDEDGLALVNWIAEATLDPEGGWPHKEWFRAVEIDSFIDRFETFKYHWLDVPSMIRASSGAYENPMIDRDPVPTWVDGGVLLMGDAAHPMYPTGSNGASQAIIDARQIGAHLLRYGVTPTALAAFNAAFCGPLSELVLRNRGAGPFEMLNILDERCGGVFDDIEAVFPLSERTELMQSYKTAAGFEMERLNSAPPILPPRP